MCSWWLNHLFIWVARVGFSFYFFCLEFVRQLMSVNVCLSPHLEVWVHDYFQYFSFPFFLFFFLGTPFTQTLDFLLLFYKTKRFYFSFFFFPISFLIYQSFVFLFFLTFLKGLDNTMLDRSDESRYCCVFLMIYMENEVFVIKHVHQRWI